MSRKKQIDSIKALMDQYIEIVNSDRNKENLKLWQDSCNWNRDFWRGLPVPAKDRKAVPFTVAPDNSIWGKILNTSLVDYYGDPYTYLETQLKMKIYHFNNFHDNTPFTNELYLWFGVITELSVYGCEVEFFPHKEAWIKGSIINEEEDLERMEFPDFYKSGLMPRVHQFYEVLSELADGKLKVMFPRFARGPFCMAVHMRGYDKILYDCVLNPDFVHKLMRFIVDVNKNWTEERNKLVGEPKRKCKLYNDEIDCPTISPSIYDEMIFPYEKELSEYYGGIQYWHSCGNTTKFLESISKLPDLDIFHVGPWTSYQKADEVFKDKTALDICLNPQKDILETDEQGMRSKLIDIRETCKHNNFAVRADAFMPHGAIEDELDKIRKWISIAGECLSGK